MAKYEVNGQVYDFPDDMPPEVALSIISVANPEAFEETPTTGNPQLDSVITQSNNMQEKVERSSPFVGTPLAFPPVSQDQMLDVLGIPKDAPVEPAAQPSAEPAKPQLDMSKPYGGLFTPVEPVYEDTTIDVSTDPAGNPLGSTYQQTDTYEKKIPPSELPNKPDWMTASSSVYEALNDKPFTGTPEELADYGVQVAQFFGNNLVLGGLPLAYQVSQMPEDKRQAFLYLLDTYERVGLTPGNAARAVGYSATDPTNIISAGSILASFGAGAPAVAAGKTVTINVLKQIIRNPAFIAGLDASLSGAGFDLTKQSVEVSAGRKDEIDLGQTAEVAGISGLVGAGFGGALGMTSRLLAREASPTTLPKIESDFVPPPQATSEMDKIVSTFEQGLKEELAKETLSPELQDIVNTFGDDVANALKGSETLEQKAQSVLDRFTPSHADVAAANDNGGRVLDVTNDNYKNSANNDNSILVDNDNPARIVVDTTDRIDIIKDQIDGIGIDERKALNENNPPKPEVSEGVRELLDRVPDFEEYSMDYVRKAIKPVMDEFLDIAKQGPDELRRALSYRLNKVDLEKLISITTSAASRTQRAINEVEAELSVLLKSEQPSAYRIEALENRREELVDQLANIQILEFPSKTDAGRLLKLSQIENAINAENKVDVAKLQALGVPTEDIGRMIAEASDSVSKNELLKLFAERDSAMKVQNREEVVKLDAKIDEALEKLKEATEGAKDSVLKKAVGVLVEMRTTSLISSTGTLTRNLVGGISHKILDRSAEIIGLIRSEGLKSGREYIAAQGIGRSIAMKAGYKSQIEAFKVLLKNSAKEAINERSLLDVGDYGDRNIRKISSTALGLDPNSVAGKTADIGGRIWRAQGLPMLMSDEVLGGIFARAEIGEQAGFDFVQIIAKKRASLNIKLKDPNLKPATRAKYEQQLADLKDIKKATIDMRLKNEKGEKLPPMSLADFIEHRVKSVMDETGRITDEAVRERVNYLLLRNKPTGGISQNLEKFANMYNGAPRLLQSFVRTPINEFKRTLEYIPGTYHFKFMHDLGADLASKDPRVVARAKGKFYVGWMLASSALVAALYGLSSPSAPRTKDDRLTNEASSAMAPKSLNIFGAETDISGLGPWGNIYTFGANFFRDIDLAWRKIDQEVAIGNREGASKQIEALEEYERKGLAVVFAYMAGVANAVTDTNALEAMNTATNAAWTVANSADDNETTSKAATEFAQKYATSFNWSIIKQFNNVIDPTKVSPNGIIESYKASLGFKDTQAVVRDAMGYPIEGKTPFRSIIGPFGPQNLPEKGNLIQDVRDDLEIIREQTGRSFILDTNPPEVRNVDLSKFPSVVSGRSVYDTYGDNLQKVVLANSKGVATTLPEAMKEIIGDRITLGFSLGNDSNRGEFFKIMSDVINKYKAAAWAQTKIDERNNKELVKAFNWQIDLKEAAGDSQYDIAPPKFQRLFQ